MKKLIILFLFILACSKSQPTSEYLYEFCDAGSDEVEYYKVYKYKGVCYQSITNVRLGLTGTFILDKEDCRKYCGEEI